MSNGKSIVKIDGMEAAKIREFVGVFDELSISTNGDFTMTFYVPWSAVELARKEEEALLESTPPSTAQKKEGRL